MTLSGNEKVCFPIKVIQKERDSLIRKLEKEKAQLKNSSNNCNREDLIDWMIEEIYENFDLESCDNIK